MNIYGYEALNTRGRAVKDTVRAISSEDAIYKIKMMSLFPTSVRLLMPEDITSLSWLDRLKKFFSSKGK